MLRPAVLSLVLAPVLILAFTVAGLAEEQRLDGLGWFILAGQVPLGAAVLYVLSGGSAAPLRWLCALGVTALLVHLLSGMSLAIASALGIDLALAGWLLHWLGRPPSAVPLPPSTLPLPADEQELLRRLDELMVAKTLTPSRTPLLTAARELLVEGVGAAYVIGPMAFAFGFAAAGLGMGYGAAHGVALAAAVWGVATVTLERFTSRQAGWAQVALATCFSVGALVLLVVVFLRLRGLTQGDPLDPGGSITSTWHRMHMSPELDRAVALSMAFGIPSLVWVWLGRHREIGQEAAHWTVRRLSVTVLSTPFLFGGVLVFFADYVYFMIGLVHVRGALFWAPTFLSLPPVAAVHSAVAVFAFAGLRLAQSGRRRGLQRTIADRRRQIIRALVDLRAARAEQATAVADDSLE